MWRDNEEEAIYIGLSLDYYWKLNPKEYAKHCKVFLKKEEQNAKTVDSLNHILGQYIGYAVNNPKEYPKHPVLENMGKSKKETKKQTIDDMENMARRNTLFMGGVINDNRRITSTDNG